MAKWISICAGIAIAISIGRRVTGRLISTDACAACVLRVCCIRCRKELVDGADANQERERNCDLPADTLTGSPEKQPLNHMQHLVMGVTTQVTSHDHTRNNAKYLRLGSLRAWHAESDPTRQRPGQVIDTRELVSDPQE
jgi:hypothetical protein